MDDNNFYIPRKLNAKALMMLWEADTFIITISTFLIFAMMGSFIIACFVAWVFGKFWVKLKEEGGDGLMIKMFYWFLYSGFIVKEEKLQSEIREYIG